MRSRSFYSLIFLVATGAAGVARAVRRHHLSALPVLIGPAYCMVPVGFLALTMLMLIDLPRVREGRRCCSRKRRPTIAEHGCDRWSARSRSSFWC